MVEEWRTVIYDGEVFEQYEVSNTGKVRSLNYYGKTGRVQELKQTKNKHGYLQISLCKNGRVKKCLVHRVVGFTWIPNDDPINKTEINHISEIKTQNDIGNLEWVTPSQNINYGTRIQRQREKMIGMKLSEEAKQKMSEAKKDRYNGADNPNAHAVICLETLEVFDTIKDAKEWLGKGNIIANIKGRAKSAGGYHWMYHDEWLEQQEK